MVIISATSHKSESVIEDYVSLHFTLFSVYHITLCAIIRMCSYQSSKWSELSYECGASCLWAILCGAIELSKWDELSCTRCANVTLISSCSHGT